MAKVRAKILVFLKKNFSHYNAVFIAADSLQETNNFWRVLE